MIEMLQFLFKPAIALMNRLRYPFKFALIGAVLKAPILVLSYLYISTLNDERLFLERELVGIEYVSAMRPLLEHIPRHRGMTNGFLNGNEAFRPKILEARQLIDGAFANLAAVDRKLGGELGVEKYPEYSPEKLISRWNDLKQRSFEGQAKPIFQEHTELIGGLIRHMEHISDLSNMTVDPKLDSYYSINLIVNAIPKLTEIMGQGRGFGSGVAAKGTFTPDSWARLSTLNGKIIDTTKAMSAAVDAVFKNNRAIEQQLGVQGRAAVADAESFISVLRDKMLDSDKIEIDSSGVFKAGSSAIGTSFKLYDALLPELVALIESRVADDEVEIIIDLAVLVLVLVISNFLFAGVYYSTLNTIHTLEKMTGQLADGDLTARAHLQTRDETRVIGDGFDRMAESFSELVGQVKSATDQVSTAAETMTGVTDETHNGVIQQQQETEQVAAAMNEMNATVQEVARNAEAAADAASKANQEASNGKQVVSKTIDSINDLAAEVENVAGVIHGLEQDSENIGTVLDVIKGIAEQTNLLALNAAIEAARAGEQGRGFAVVADEVRTLASRTQTSAGEIEAMILKLQDAARNAVVTMEQGQARTQESVTQAAEAGASLESITQSVAIINDMNTQIASASEQQSAVADEINRNVVSISEISEKTAAGAQQTNSNSSELSRLAAELQQVISKFQV